MVMDFSMYIILVYASFLMVCHVTSYKYCRGNEVCYTIISLISILAIITAMLLVVINEKIEHLRKELTRR